MRRMLLALPLAMLASFPALAASQDKPITDREVDAVDVATTPMTDLNLRKDKIPQVLLDAQERPYDLAGLKRCKALVSAVNELNAVLGGDLDLPQEQRGRISPGRVAKSVVGSFIPFRGVIREVSGANDQERRLQAAIEAGLARRGFLKGVGQARDCKYPARAASSRDVQRYVNEKAERENGDGKDEKDNKD